MKAELGKHFFGRHRSQWGIWVWDHVAEQGNSGKFIKDVATYDEAVKTTYKLNGWGEPQIIKRKF